eukprot:2519954-Amphidinium_carterae.1
MHELLMCCSVEPNPLSASSFALPSTASSLAASTVTPSWPAAPRVPSRSSLARCRSWRRRRFG